MTDHENELLLKTFVDAFLACPLPDSVCSDPCVTMPRYPHRSGTNLLTADQATQMFSAIFKATGLSRRLLDQENELDRLRAEVEDTYRVLNNTRMTAADAMAKVKAQNAALREALEDCERVLRLSPPTISGRDFNSRGDAIRKAQAALSDTDGSGYISRDQVRPLVEALKAVVTGFRDAPELGADCVCLDKETALTATAALASVNLTTV